MRHLFIIFILLFSVCTLKAQTEAAYLYFGSAWNPANKTEAFYYEKILKEKDGWHRQDFWVKSDIMKMEGYYADSAQKIKNGVFAYYTEKGGLIDSVYFAHGKEKSACYFYENRSLKACAVYDTNRNIIQQQGWDESGKEIPGYIYQKVAEFPGGEDEWQHYIIVELQKNLPKAFKKGQIWGEAVISFLILEDGSIDEVKVERSSGYPELDFHALNMIRNSPKWIAAIQFNRNVIYRQKQTLTYLKQE